MTYSRKIDELLINGDSLCIIDVRKPKALQSASHCIPGSRWRHPFDAANWAGKYRRQTVVVYCVHGHEVSQSVAGFLRDEGIDATILEGGFEAWLEAGQPVIPFNPVDVCRDE